MTRTRRSPSNELRRAGLSRDKVLGTAVALADEEGLDGLSMRKLAKRLGVEAMSLYNHVPGKERLVDGMVDLVFDEIELPNPDGLWKEQLRHRAVSLRATLRSHPWAVGVIEARWNLGESQRRQHAATLGCLRNAGFPVAMALHAHTVLDAYIYGHALQERAIGLRAPKASRAATRRMLEEPDFAPDAYPATGEVLRHIADHGLSHDEEFLFGLNLVLDGLEHQLARSGRRRRS